MTRQTVLLALCVAASCERVWTFVGPGKILSAVPTPTHAPAARRPTSLRMEAEELEQLNPAIKGKRLEVVDEAKGVWKYEFDIEAPGPRTQSLHHRIIREIKNKSDFPGYRKGEIPSRLLPEANKYVIEEIMNEQLLTAMETYGLVGAEGDGSEADILTDIEEMLKVFKPGKPLKFSCTFDAKPKPESDDAPVVDASLANAEE